MFLTCLHCFKHFAFRIETKIQYLGLQSSLWSATVCLPRHKMICSVPHFKCLTSGGVRHSAVSDTLRPHGL